ncbi:MAG: alcohol dehydrogenase catalytic domain-containing protein [Treponema sp.]|jgi:L-iditol 2-dehydrogenase|nr:alcohol dehydrogenase catalytic domain-containing protein [Treponema sp.]
MKGLVKTARGPGNIEVRELPVPSIKNDDEVLIKISAAGVCGTDIHIYRDEFPYWPPVVMGHEFSGVIEEAGPAVKGFKPGDRVVAEPHTHFCGSCYLCRAGHIQVCSEKRSPGWGMDGAFADYLVMPSLFLHHIPGSISDEIAALTEPAAIVVTGLVERGKAGVGDTVVIVGAGPIGLLSLVTAKAAGAKKVFVLGTDADEAMRFPAAKALGANEIFNVTRVDAADRILEATDGIGADLVVEASGAAEGINTAAAAAKKMGRVTVLGLPGTEKIHVPWGNMVRKALEVSFCFSSSVSSWEKAISLLSSSPLDLNALISHRTKIDNWEQVFADIESGKALKALFIPRQG